MEQTWFYERLFVVVMVKDKNAMAKKYSMKDTMSVKISFLHYI